MWRELIGKLSSECKFAQPASSLLLAAAEQAVKLKFPDELSSLLLESNGVLGPYSIGLVWPIEAIRDNNLSFRQNEDFCNLYMPFDNLLFFADAGNGDQFAFPIQAGCIRRADIFCWNHEDDSRTWIAPSLEKYIDWWLSGRLTV